MGGGREESVLPEGLGRLLVGFYAAEPDVVQQAIIDLQEVLAKLVALLPYDDGGVQLLDRIAEASPRGGPGY